MGLVAYRVQLMGGCCWSRLLAGSLPVGWLVKLRQVGEGPGVSPWYGRPREWGAQMVD